jgi:hypothetical protein
MLRSHPFRQSVLLGEDYQTTAAPPLATAGGSRAAVCGGLCERVEVGVGVEEQVPRDAAVGRAWSRCFGHSRVLLYFSGVTEQVPGRTVRGSISDLVSAPTLRLGAARVGLVAADGRQGGPQDNPPAGGCSGLANAQSAELSKNP